MKNREIGSLTIFASIQTPFPVLKHLTAKAVCLAAAIKKNSENLGA